MTHSELTAESMKLKQQNIELIEALEEAIPYMQDLIEIEKAGQSSGFKPGIVKGHLRLAEKAIAKAKQ